MNRNIKKLAVLAFLASICCTAYAIDCVYYLSKVDEFFTAGCHDWAWDVLTWAYDNGCRQ